MRRIVKTLFRVAQRHRAIVASALIAVTALGIFALLWFQPWKLFVDETVNEAAPSPLVQPSSSALTPVALSDGAFRSLEHRTTGRARIIQQSDGSRIVRLEDLNTSNGPDLVVLLSDTPATDDDWRAYDDGSTIYLGKLKGNIGSQNYALPARVDLSRYRSVVVWCRRFTVGFGAAPISLA